MRTCPACRRPQPEINRFCTQCGQRLDGNAGAAPRHRTNADQPEQLNIHALYGMVAVLILVLLFPPWEATLENTPEFLGMHFILSPPIPEAIVSRMLLTIELLTITIAGLYGAFLFRKK